MIKSFQTLYSKDSKGKIRVWFQQQEGAKYRTVSGVYGSDKLVTSEWTVAEGKNQGKSNETLPVEQAIKEVEANYTKQRETGYFDNIQDVNKELYFSPMLAKQWEDYEDQIDWSKGVWISPKMDGLRCIITKEGAFSRNGKVFLSFPHILRELQPLFTKFPDLILDGECYCERLSDNFNKIISLAKKTKPTPQDIQESEKYLQYWIFDCPSIEGNFNSRYTYLQKQILIDNGFLNNNWIKLCKHTLIYDSTQIKINLNKYIEQGFEGLMVNTYDGKYEQKRSRNLLKNKLFKDIEAEICGIVEGLGNRSGMFGYAQMKLPNGKTFDSNARGNEILYKEILKNKNKYIGKKATVRFQDYTPDGIPRFPVIVDFDRFD